MKKAEKLQSTDETAVTYEPMLGNVIFSKEEAVTTYLKEIGIAIQVLLQQRDTASYYFSSESSNNMRIKVIEVLHKNAMDALATI